MASEQMPRREDKKLERETHFETQRRDPVMNTAEAKRGGGEGVHETKGQTAEVKVKLGGVEGQGRGKENIGEGRKRVGGGNEGGAAVITCKLEGNDQKGREEKREENEQSSLEEIGKYRAQAQQNALDAISAAQEKYQRAKQEENLSCTTTQIPQEKRVQAKNTGMDRASQAKDVTGEKGQKGYVPSKDSTPSVAKSALDYTAPVAEKAKDYTVQAAEKAKSAGGTTAQYVGEKAVQAKDVTLDTGKSAANVASDLKDKATTAGWKAAHYSTEKTVEGTKAAANVAGEAAGYAGQKASELAAKSMDAVKGLASAAGETVKEYTARKKEEAERDLEAKKAAQNQVF